MARRDIGNAEFIDHDTESGIPKGAGKVAGVRNWTLRLGETDKDTRKGGRSPVTMLPARLAIVNVYQLADKIKLGGKKDKSTKGKKGNKGNKQTSQTPSAGSKYGYGLVAVSEEDGVELNENGYPVSKPDEDRSTYNKRVFAWLNKTGRMNKNTQTKFGKKEEAKAEGGRTPEEIESAQKIREARDQADAAVRAANAKQPRWILWDIVKAKKIKTEPTVSYYEQHKDDYERLDPTDENFDRIKQSIGNAERAHILKPKQGEPATIIAILPTQMQPPTAFYIRKNVLQPTPRRKKMTRTSVKRPLKATAKKHPVPHGNKRRVVMKKKGGKR